jgi:sugar phosphate isomerase/epimerase
MSAGWRRSELAYCSNVHPGEQLDAVERTLLGRVAAVRARRGLATAASGLWLAEPAIRALDDPARRERWRGTLADAGIELITLNGFPYGNFHAESVKERVYTPDWSDPRRRDYTLALAALLAECLPKQAWEGTISTLPRGVQPSWTRARHAAALTALVETARELGELAQRHGHAIRVCLEMEPGCVLERSDQVVELFTRDLPAAAAKLGVGAALIDAHLGVCFDICHQAVMFEDVQASLARLAAANVHVGKIQVSSALEAALPAQARTALAQYDEPRYLHQVRTPPLADGSQSGVMDLGAALEADALPEDAPWRVHFHVPIQTDTLADGMLTTTRAEIGRVLDYLAREPALHPQLEVETYTWHVLPPDGRPADDEALIDGLAAELTWLEGELAARKLLAT